MNAPPSLVGPNVIAEMCEMARDVPPGAFVEVGVYKGGTAWHLNKICKEQGRDLFLCDTFKGIPYRNRDMGDPCLVGDFSDTSESQVREAIPEAKFIVGVFPQSAAEIPMMKLAFVHLDCDQYQSYLESILFLWPRMVKGGVMWFDDYALPGAKQAIDDIFGHRVETAECGKQYVRI